MTEPRERVFTEVPRKKAALGFRPLAYVGLPILAILFQIYLPRFFEMLGYLELPLLVTVYFALMRRHPITGLLMGASVGMVQDSLNKQPIGLFGIVKTLVGYFAASVSMRFDVDNQVIQFILVFFFFMFHEFFYWVLERALLGQLVGFDIEKKAVLGLLNAAVALPLFMLFDKMKEHS